MRERLTKTSVFTIPNGLSLFRILLIPVILWLYCGKKLYLATVGVIALSGFTDVLDGRIARKFNMVSDVGKVLDPIADKLTQAALVICLISRYWEMIGLLVLFAVKEGLMLLWGYLTLRHTDTVNSAKWYGKLSTVVLYSVMMLLILVPWIPRLAAQVLMGLCAAVMLLSLILYGRFYYGILHRERPEKEKKEKKRSGRQMALRVLLIALWAALIVACLVFRDELSLDTIVRAAPGNMAAAAAVMLALFALKSVSMVLYSGILYAASGLLFPLPVAIVVNLCGTAIMASLPYFIGKRSGTSMVESLREKYPKVRQLQTVQKRNNFMFSYGARIVRLPSDIVSLYMGASGVDYRAYLAGSMLGLLPHTVTYSIMGTSITDIRSPAFLISLGVEVAYVVVTAVVYALYAKRHTEQPGKEEPGHGQAG